MNFEIGEKMIPSIAMRKWAKDHGLEFEYIEPTIPHFLEGRVHGTIWGYIKNKPIFIFVIGEKNKKFGFEEITLTSYNGNFYEGFSYNILENFIKEHNEIDDFVSGKQMELDKNDHQIFVKRPKILGKTYQLNFSEITFSIMGNYFLMNNKKLPFVDVFNFHKSLLSEYFSHHSLFTKIVYYLGMMRGLVSKHFIDEYRNEIIINAFKKVSNQDVVSGLLSAYEDLYHKNEEV